MFPTPVFENGYFSERDVCKTFSVHTGESSFVFSVHTQPIETDGKRENFRFQAFSGGGEARPGETRFVICTYCCRYLNGKSYLFIYFVFLNRS